MLRPPHDRYQRLYVYHLAMDLLPEITDPDFIGGWLEDGKPILFFHHDKQQLVEELCRQHNGTIFYQADLDYSDWEAGHAITAFAIDDLTVAPIWEKTPADIRLDPSVIFGSGFHPTTRMCLAMLLKYLSAPELAINTMLDLGCGTGLLGIAAAMRGVKKITAVDYNSLACDLTDKNAERNGVGDRIVVEQRDLLKGLPDTKVDLVVANLYRDLLRQLFQNKAFWQGNLYIISGFISGMEEELLAALPDKGLRMLERTRGDNWCLWVLLRTGQC